MKFHKLTQESRATQQKVEEEGGSARLLTGKGMVREAGNAKRGKMWQWQEIIWSSHNSFGEGSQGRDPDWK